MVRFLRLAFFCLHNLRLNQVLDGIGYSFGIFVKPLEEHFDGAGKGKISLVRFFFSVVHDNFSSLDSGWEHPGWLHYAGRTNILRDGEQVWTPIDMHW